MIDPGAREVGMILFKGGVIAQVVLATNCSVEEATAAVEQVFERERNVEPTIEKTTEIILDAVKICRPNGGHE